MFKEFRERQGMTLKEASALIGVHIHTLIRWESGQFKPPLDKVQAMVRIYKLSKADRQKLLMEDVG